VAEARRGDQAFDDLELFGAIGHNDRSVYPVAGRSSFGDDAVRSPGHWLRRNKVTSNPSNGPFSERKAAAVSKDGWSKTPVVQLSVPGAEGPRNTAGRRNLARRANNEEGREAKRAPVLTSFRAEGPPAACEARHHSRATRESFQGGVEGLRGRSLVPAHPAGRAGCVMPFDGPRSRRFHPDAWDDVSLTFSSPTTPAGWSRRPPAKGNNGEIAKVISGPQKKSPQSSFESIFTARRAEHNGESGPQPDSRGRGDRDVFYEPEVIDEAANSRPTSKRGWEQC